MERYTFDRDSPDLSWAVVPALPGRYLLPWRAPFDERVRPALGPGARILDVGSGSNPSIVRAVRPVPCHYVGLDLSAAELNLAPAGSYDEFIESDISLFHPALVGKFDIVVSWQVLEHVRYLDRALENIRAYLRPGGKLVALFSGRFSIFAMLNLAIRTSLSARIMRKLHKRDPKTVFPAYYHRCWHRALVTTFANWKEVEIVDLYRGANYFRFSRLAQSLYLGYEDWICKRQYSDLATHYLVDAIK